jgi:hypothetical protein
MVVYLLRLALGSELVASVVEGVDGLLGVSEKYGGFGIFVERVVGAYFSTPCSR